MDPELKLRTGDLEWREVEGEVIVLDLQGSVYMSLNGSGAVCWRALAAGASRPDLVKGLMDRYRVSPERAERDVDHFLAELRSRELIDPASAGYGGE